MKPKILAFAGSTRANSFNKKLVRNATELLKEMGAEVTYLDLREYPLPLYDGDLEEKEGIPENGMKLKKLFMQHQGLVLSTAEYNSSITGVLKNTIDWVSRPHPDESEYLICFKEKLALLLSASPGNLGGMRALVVVRMLLENIGTMVFPGQLTVSKADQAFDEKSYLLDKKKGEDLKKLLTSYSKTLSALHSN